MPKLIGDRGPASARIVAIGEAPGKREWEEGAPFVGPSGWLLDQWQRDAGIDRSSVYYTNSVRYWPGEFAPAHLKVGLNDFKWLPKEIVANEQIALRSRLAALQDPIVLVPTGSQALHALGIAGRISDYRGSILSVGLVGPNEIRREVKTIPTIHPAATFRRPVLSRFCIADWQKIATECQFRETRLPTRRTIIASDGEFRRFMGCLSEHGGPVALDIECSIKDGSLQCIAASYDPSFGLVIPLAIQGHTRDSDPFLRQCWEWARALCARHYSSDGRAISKVLQNGLFDAFILKRRGNIELLDYDYDTLEMDHALFPNDGSDPQAGEDGGDDIKIPMHSLSVLCSLHTRQPYYKGDARDGFKFGWNRLEDLWSYCMDEDTLVLTEGLTWVKIKTLDVGSKVISISEYPEGRCSRRIISSSVDGVFHSIKPSFRVITTEGEFIASADHKVLARYTDTGYFPFKWHRIDELQQDKSAIAFMVKPWEIRRDFDAGWLSGMMDGEGCLERAWEGKNLTVAIAQKPGPVLDRAEFILVKEGFDISRREVRGPNPTQSIFIRKGTHSSIKALGYYQPIRLLNNFKLAIRSNTPPAFGRPVHAKVLSVEPVGDRRVVDIKTTAKTFIANGFVVHNCALDAMVTIEIYYKLRALLEERGMI